MAYHLKAFCPMSFYKIAFFSNGILPCLAYHSTRRHSAKWHSAIYHSAYHSTNGHFAQYHSAKCHFKNDLPNVFPSNIILVNGSQPKILICNWLCQLQHMDEDHRNINIHLLSAWVKANSSMNLVCSGLSRFSQYLLK